MGRASWLWALGLAMAMMTSAPAALAEQQGDDDEAEGDDDDGGLEHPGNQIPAVRNGGVLNPGETAWVVYLDGQLLPPALMLSVQHGVSYWITLGADLGGGYGIFQALLRVRMENMPPLWNHRFFWGGHIRTGFKQHQIDLGQGLAFDDLSWIITYENSFALRLGAERRHILYLDTVFYADFDITRRDRQVDLYLMPVMLGYELVVDEHYNFFVELGMGYSFNGTETSQGLLYARTWFPMAALGFAYRQRGRVSALDAF